MPAHQLCGQTAGPINLQSSMQGAVEAVEAGAEVGAVPGSKASALRCLIVEDNVVCMRVAKKNDGEARLRGGVRR